MEVPLKLARREVPPNAVTDAFLLYGEFAESLATVCALLSGDRVPDVFRVHGGFIIIPRDSRSRTPPGTIRLRRLAGDMYIPIDASLRPALLTDEIVALTAAEGLILLPGTNILAYDPARPLPISQWLAVPTIQREDWQPFPSRPELADKLSKIERPVPPVALMELLAEGAPDDTQPLGGSAGHGEAGGKESRAIPEDARPPSGSFLKRLAAGAGLGIGSFLVGLASLLRIPGLARLGGDLARRALETIPRLSEKIIGDQEAALREVLRQLQSGDIEKGLRRAPIAVADPEQPAPIDPGAQLGSRDPRYSLRDLIGGGEGRVWLGGGNVWDELAREYRKLAYEAIQRGDYRRAAYLHGFLLRDMRSAANALMAGGLFHDAALLFRDRLKDYKAAAEAFERAGNHDEALRLYEQTALFEQAGELLKRLGEIERATEYFLRAADRLAKQGHWLAAGDFVRNKASRGDLASFFYKLGWESSTADKVPCGERLFDGYLVTEDFVSCTALLLEAETALATQCKDAGRFFNYAIRVSDGFLPEETRSNLIDRTRLIFATFLRERAGDKAEAGHLISDLFGQHRVWAAPVVRDATHAIKSLKQPPQVSESPRPREPLLRLGDGTVSAVVVARGTFDVVIGTTTGVTCWRAAKSQVVPVCSSIGGKVVALATDSEAKIIYVLFDNLGELLLQCLTSFQDGLFKPKGQVVIPKGELNRYLQPAASYDEDNFRVTIAEPDSRITLVGAYLQRQPAKPFLPTGSSTNLLVEGGGGWVWDWDGRDVRYSVPGFSPLGPWIAVQLQWIPHIPNGSSLSQAPLDWLTPGVGILEVTGIDKDGAVYWSEVDARNPYQTKVRTGVKVTGQKENYAASCLIAPGQVVAATTRSEIHLLRFARASLELQAIRDLDIPARVVAVVSRPNANEVVAVLEDASAIRLPMDFLRSGVLRTGGT